MEKSKDSSITLCLLAPSYLSLNDAQSTRKVKEQPEVVMGLERSTLDDTEVVEDTRNNKNKSLQARSITNRNQPKCNQSIYDYMRLIVVCD
jgi:hypothetical protein